MRFPEEISCFLLHNLLMRFHAFWAATRFPYEISCFLALMICPCEILYFLLHNFRTRYPDEILRLFGPLRALRMRFHACLAVMRYLDEISCFLAAECSF